MDIRTTYEVSVSDFDSGLTVQAIVLPRRSVDTEAVASLTPDDLREFFEMDSAPVYVAADRLTSALANLLVDGRPTFLEPILLRGSAIDFAAYLAQGGDWLPWESSPLKGVGLGAVMMGCMKYGSPLALAAHVAGLPLLVLVCVGGVAVLYPVAVGVGDELGEAGSSAIRMTRDGIRRLFSRLRRRPSHEEGPGIARSQGDRHSREALDREWPPIW
jgi:hypothetical protein